MELSLDAREANITSREINLTSREIDLTSREVNITSKEVSIAAKEVNVTSTELNITSKETNLTSKEANPTSREINVTSRETNLASRELNLASRELNLASIELNPGSAERIPRCRKRRLDCETRLPFRKTTGYATLFCVNYRTAALWYAPFLCLLCAACAFGPSARKTTTYVFPPGEIANEAAPSPVQSGEILEYQGRAGGVPPWLEAWFSGGSGAVEALEDYAEVYAFVAEMRGKSARAVEYWLGNLDAGRLFPRAASARFRFRFARDLTDGVDQVYGDYYEAAVKAAHAVRFSGVEQAGAFWIRERQSSAAGAGEYHCFVLLLVPRERYRQEVTGLLESLGGETHAANAQSAAFARLREHFFDGF